MTKVGRDEEKTWPLRRSGTALEGNGMRFGVNYEIVIEMDWPGDGAAEAAYTTWARQIDRALTGLNCRIVQQGPHVKVAAPEINAAGVGDLTWVLGLVLSRLDGLAPGNLRVEIHEGADAAVEYGQKETTYG